jgi:hypothetical protein
LRTEQSSASSGGDCSIRFTPTRSTASFPPMERSVHDHRATPGCSASTAVVVACLAHRLRAIAQRAPQRCLATMVARELRACEDENGSEEEEGRRRVRWLVRGWPEISSWLLQTAASSPSSGLTRALVLSSGRPRASVAASLAFPATREGGVWDARTLVFVLHRHHALQRAVRTPALSQCSHARWIEERGGNRLVLEERNERMG